MLKFLSDIYFIITFKGDNIMTWNERLAIGIPEIDKQHKELCDKVDELYAACSKGKGSTEISKTLDFLEAYTVRHFADEEKIQLKIKYPNYIQHKAMHTDFAKQVTAAKKDLIESGMSTPKVINVTNIVSKWLVNHIMKEDSQLKNYNK